MFAALGVHVTVIDKRPRPLEFLDCEITDELVHQMRKCDVTFRCGDGVESMEIIEDVAREGLIELESGKHMVADLILFSVGRVGATDTLQLEAAGLKADERGRLKVNDYYQTEVPHVYAAGDVIGYPALAATSSEQGRLAACHMFDLLAQPMGKHFPIGIYSIPEISMVGQTEEELTNQKVPYETGIARFNEIARGQISGDDSGMFKMIFGRRTGSFLASIASVPAPRSSYMLGRPLLAWVGDSTISLTRSSITPHWQSVTRSPLTTRLTRSTTFAASRRSRKSKRLQR